jgi:ribosomal protein S18 acetylase RimI-like enzyme
MNVRIFNQRNITNSEVEELLSLFRNSSAESDYMSIGEINDIDTLNKVLTNKNLIHFFGYVDSIPVSYCQVIYKTESINFNSGAKINAISVLPEKRGQGLGKELLQEVVTTLKKNQNIKNIHLEVVKDNVVAINLYKEVGFQKVGELKDIFKKDNVLMDIVIYSLQVN